MDNGACPTLLLEKTRYMHAFPLDENSMVNEECDPFQRTRTIRDRAIPTILLRKTHHGSESERLFQTKQMDRIVMTITNYWEHE